VTWETDGRKEGKRETERVEEEREGSRWERHVPYTVSDKGMVLA